MNFLIDTCDALWFFTGDKKLIPSRVDLLNDPRNIVFFSSVSAVEIAIKHSIGKLTLPEPPATYIPRPRLIHHFAELPLQESAALLLDTLPFIHRDPFDRQLICQAMAHGLPLMSSDPLIQQYPGIEIL